MGFFFDILTYYTVKVNPFFPHLRRFCRIMWREEGMPIVKAISDTIELIVQEEQRQWTCAEIPVLQAGICVPQCQSGMRSRAMRRFNRYYRQCARSFLSYCGRWLYPEALAAFEHARDESAPLPCAQANLTCTVTCNERGVLSLYSDCTEWAGTPEALTLRRADTWNLETGYPITASECFPRGTRVRALCLTAAREQCRRQQESSLAVYHPDFSRRLRRNLNLRNFYLSEKGFHFFYQPWAIAPGFEGCPTFLLPFSDSETDAAGPLWPAGNPCNAEKSIV